MSTNGQSRIPEILERHEGELLEMWLEQQKATGPRHGSSRDGEMRRQCGEFLGLMARAARGGNLTHIDAPEWTETREMLAQLSRARSQYGATPAETASFVFSLKKPLFDLLRRTFSGDAETLANETWLGSEMLDRLGLFTTEVYQKSREEVIRRQQEEMIELSTPVVKLWEGILALPVIGTLDSNRTAVIMESLLERIVETGAGVAILDITGVLAMDTEVAQHLIKTATAARLMGAECIISGIRPQIAQTIVHLGVDLREFITKATLADAFELALERAHLKVCPAGERRVASS
jgi:rsbT co-antagonist protein RsbR